MANEGSSVAFTYISPTGVASTVNHHVSPRAVEVLKQLGYEPTVTEHCAKVSIVGAGMAGIPGVTAKIVTDLAERGNHILESAYSQKTNWVLLQEPD